MMLGLYIEVLKMRRITQPEEGGHHPRWERGVMLRKGLPICPACPKNLLWKNRGCKSEGPNHVKQTYDFFSISFMVLSLVLDCVIF